jgi:hypothetical protein
MLQLPVPRGGTHNHREPASLNGSRALLEIWVIFKIQGFHGHGQALGIQPDLLRMHGRVDYVVAGEVEAPETFPREGAAVDSQQAALPNGLDSLRRSTTVTAPRPGATTNASFTVTSMLENSQAR